MDDVMRINRLLLCFCILILLGCSESTEREATTYGPDGSYRSIAVVVPKHYDAWVDTLIMESLSEDIGWRAPIGSIACCWKAPSGKHAEWQTMPELVLIRWFSFAEQQSYEALIKFENPDEIEEKMKEVAPFESFGEIAEYPRDNLVFGLAPGGTVVVWIMNVAENAIEVGRYEARPITNEKSDYSQWVDEYMKKEGEYLKENGIKLEGW